MAECEGENNDQLENCEIKFSIKSGDTKITDVNGNEVTVQPTGDGKYSFVVQATAKNCECGSATLESTNREPVSVDLTENISDTEQVIYENKPVKDDDGNVVIEEDESDKGLTIYDASSDFEWDGFKSGDGKVTPTSVQITFDAEITIYLPNDHDATLKEHEKQHDRINRKVQEELLEEELRDLTCEIPADIPKEKVTSKIGDIYRADAMEYLSRFNSFQNQFDDISKDDQGEVIGDAQDQKEFGDSIISEIESNSN